MTVVDLLLRNGALIDGTGAAGRPADVAVTGDRITAVGAPGALSPSAGTEVVEVYGPPAKLQQVEREANEAGLRTRRTGTSISILNANGYEGERRPSNLEDVFVLLTGEEIG